MFEMARTNFPPRTKKDFARAQQLRAFTRHRNWPAPSPLDDMWAPGMNRNAWPPDFRRDGFASSGPFSPQSFDEVDNAPSPRPRTPGSAVFGSSAYGSPFLKDSSGRYPSAAYIAKNRMPFDQAAHHLADATYQSWKVCEKSWKTFGDETRSISRYADPKLVAVLWKMKLEWDGRPADERASDSDSERGRNYFTHAMVMQELVKALNAFKFAAAPDMERLNAPHAESDLQMYRMTRKKLQIALQGIEERIDNVLTQRDLMPSLVKELKDAHNLLIDIQGLWRPMEKPGGKRRSKYAWVDAWDE